ncbi:ATPase family protein associated with various cellular activities (AAA) [Muricomes intestini]|mgnify:CR=1 FL=1|jgi:SpoVK/Ycf46/Vps4 family AAA+-type ATPase|uniref:ATPase family protein associated with various cellular activities (AAA) n=1 Tax=Muricomes intestini TaxID=1796634 RepID=A0A4R3JZ67_9FIRM|nr:AAA family ATPase [Muricomes intestini]TCS72774.1 ATPase family protein associated with various cellular activities (AAA) [Muricomes intestini]
MEKYIKVLNTTASTLDALISAGGEVTRLANGITEGNDEEKSAIALLKQINLIIDSDEYFKETKQVAASLRNCIIDFYGYRKLLDICSKEKKSRETEDKRTLQELLEELNSLVGLDTVKGKVNDLIAYQKVQKLRRENNLHSSKNTLHLAFTGNPGTGKTTVARIVGRIYKEIGLLSKGNFVEVSRTDLIAGYQGQTALKVKSVIEKAKGGVLFIDEAYSITENENSDSYGKECLTELTKALEDYRDDLVVIVAGYTEPMSKFFESNPGLKSRFNTFIEFGDYDSDELDAILLSMCQNNDYSMDEEAKKLVHSYFEKQISMKDENFANGRLVRNIYDDLLMNHARRLVNVANPSRDDLSTIKVVDVLLDDGKERCFSNE